MVPPRVVVSGSYSQYFTVLRKDKGLRPILDLHFLNRSVRGLKFSTLSLKQAVSQIKSEDWCHDRSRKMHTPSFPIIGSWFLGAKAY